MHLSTPPRSARRVVGGMRSWAIPAEADGLERLGVPTASLDRSLRLEPDPEGVDASSDAGAEAEVEAEGGAGAGAAEVEATGSESEAGWDRGEGELREIWFVRRFIPESWRLSIASDWGAPGE